ncbi:MAG: asparagine synthetase B [Candidatus Cloacimonetes bacterium]|nr:asparagine synthetase B [Candidatus Cloacimonadota bacterium]
MGLGIIGLLCTLSFAELLIPMDETQANHLKAYGVAFEALKRDHTVQWLLNYRGGSWLLPSVTELQSLCSIRGVTYNIVDGAALGSIMATIAQENMETVVLEKEPRIAIYAPPNSQPWDDAVTLALTYAEIDYDTIWDREVLTGKIDDYDWLHLHHEDFTGQYGKFYRSFKNAPWYREEVRVNEAMAAELGFNKVWQLKHAVAEKIRAFVQNGGFLFAMCAACDTIDIAFAAAGVDICDHPFDGDGFDSDFRSKLQYERCFAFENFNLIADPNTYEFSGIDASDYVKLRGAEESFFLLFDFSAKYDPVPTMLTQCHTNYVDGFLGQTTAFHKRFVKNSVIILGESPNVDEVKYLHGNFGKGTFTFYGGHDPEDFKHLVGDPPTVLDLHKNSPGYRLILNNVLFPAAEKKKLKT